MSKPNINIPAEFAVNGTKTDFDNSKLLDGFDRLNPDVLAGDNLNKFIDDTYKGLNGVLELYEGCILYDSTVAYNNTSIVFYINSDDEVEVYRSLINNNLNNPLTDDTAWEKVSIGGGGGRNIGEIVPSTIPLTDAGLHLLDGALLSGSGSYADFVDYIGDLYDSGDYTAIFDTEANWQTAVATYGVCGKFVYDSVNNTVRLPKYGTQALTKISNIDTTTTIPAYGNGKTLGLTNNDDNVGLGSSAWVISYYGGLYNVAAGTSTPSGHGATSANKGFGVTTEKTESGIIVDTTSLASALKNYPLDCYYYIVVATTTKTAIEVDIDEIATDLNGKMDVDGSNASSSIGFSDGKWFTEDNQIYNGSLGAQEYKQFDISSLIANDGYEYEAVVIGKATTGTTSGNSIDFRVTTAHGQAFICACQTRSSSSVISTGSTNIVIGTNRIVTISNAANASGTVDFYIKYARRIGTNL